MSLPVRHYREPYEGLEAQLQELKGMVKIVPPLIATDRQNRWDEIGERPSDGEEEHIDVYESEAGPEEGYGFADYSRTLYSTAIVTAWELFHFYMARQLSETTVHRYDLSEHPVLARLVDDERRSWDRRFDKIKSRYNEFLSINVSSVPHWQEVEHVRELRNALVHNLGQYTLGYLRKKGARRPSGDDLNLFVRHKTDEDLVDSENIPLDEAFALQVIDNLLSAAAEVKRAVHMTRTS